jgi:hypothetical protein
VVALRIFVSAAVVVGTLIFGVSAAALGAPRAPQDMSLELAPVTGAVVAPGGAPPSSGCSQPTAYLLVDASGKTVGSATACSSVLASGWADSGLLITGYDEKLTLRSGGGTISAHFGVSFIPDSTPAEPVQFAGPDYCLSAAQPGTMVASCGGPITGATGIYASATGWVAETWGWALEPGASEPAWSPPPTVTITFN